MDPYWVINLYISNNHDINKSFIQAWEPRDWKFSDMHHVENKDKRKQVQGTWGLSLAGVSAKIFPRGAKLVHFRFHTYKLITFWNLEYNIIKMHFLFSQRSVFWESGIKEWQAGGEIPSGHEKDEDHISVTLW